MNKTMTLKITNEQHKGLLREAGKRQMLTGEPVALYNLLSEAIDNFLCIKEEKDVLKVESESDNLEVEKKQMKPRSTKEQMLEVERMLLEGVKVADISKETGVSKNAIYKRKKNLNEGES